MNRFYCTCPFHLVILRSDERDLLLHQHFGTKNKCLICSMNQDTTNGRDFEIMHEYYGSVEVFVLLYTKHNSNCTPCCIENTSL